MESLCAHSAVLSCKILFLEKNYRTGEKDPKNRSVNPGKKAEKSKAEEVLMNNELTPVFDSLKWTIE